MHRGRAWSTSRRLLDQIVSLGETTVCVSLSGRLGAQLRIRREARIRVGRQPIRETLPYLTADKQISYYDTLYANPNNRLISFVDVYDLAVRKHTNPDSKDLPALLAMYRDHRKPLFEGYLRGFVPPNKVIVSEHNDVQSAHSKRFGNNINTVTLFGVSPDDSNRGADNFMKALLNLKNCHTLIRLTDDYQYAHFATKEQRDHAKLASEAAFFPQLEVLIHYPVDDQHHLEEFFDEKNDLSGIISLNKSQIICGEKRNGEPLDRIRLGEVMLAGAKDQNLYSALWLGNSRDAFMDLNLYLMANGLLKIGDLGNDPRQAAKYFFLYMPGPTKEGIEKVLTMGAPHDP